MNRLGILCVAAVVAGAGWAAGPAAAGAYDETIQPLLEARCYDCHGVDRQRGGLRLDLRASALLGGDRGAPFMPGDSAASLLLRAVMGTEEGLDQMPPKGEPLTEAEIAAIRDWIDAGAEWPETTDTPVQQSSHWAFNTPERPPVPAVNNGEWVRNPIDAFVLARLEEEGIEPSPEAGKHTLLRRLHTDLTGLPPTPDEVDAFVNDPSPDAYEQLVNRLLASPHFGERWARKWLDLSRYADSDGYEKDLGRPHAWRYRHWLIDALNQDLPYDQFVIAQLAGDLLPNGRLEDHVATGFHRNTLTNREGGVDPEEYRIAQIIDRTNTTATAFLGLTMACAECHSHKYDPISQREYYGLFAFFNTAMEKDVPAPLDGEELAYRRAKADFDAAHAALKRETVDARMAELKASLNEWAEGQTAAPIDWEVLDLQSYASAAGATVTRLDDGSIAVSGHHPDRDRYMVSAVTRDFGYTGIRLELLPDEALPGQGPGRGKDGALVLTEFRASQANRNDPFRQADIPLRAVWANGGASADLARAVDGDGGTGWSAESPGVAVFRPQGEVGYTDGTTFTFTLEHQAGGKQTAGRFRVLATKAPVDQLNYPDAVREALLTPEDRRSDAHNAVLLDYYADSDPQMQAHRARVAGHAQAAPKPPETQAQVLVNNPEPPQTHIHIRGNFLEKGDPVDPHTPAVLPPLRPRNGTSDRLDLARWMVSPENPLTARVAVNRIWENLFGRGIVLTTEDFGTRGDPPSHPELLDWLATEFIERGWSQKDLIRLIVTSSTYRQSSAFRDDLHERDPENVLLARQSRYRVEGEIIRDQFLAVSGLLNEEVGGPSVRPPLPDGVADLGYAGSVKWAESPAPEKYRRGVYIWFQRTVPYPMLMTFDCPDRNVTAARRMRSNTPLQALTLLNSPVFHECSQALGGRLAELGGGDLDAKLRAAFELCLSRPPLPAELDTLRALYEDQRDAFAAQPDAAAKFANSHMPGDVPPADAAAHVALARVLMNLDEFMTRE